MIISIQWLKDFVDINETPNELAELLSRIGLEAEIRNDISELKNLSVAYVNKVSKHPNADKLKICEINDGLTVHQVICGAPNISSGQKVVFAKIGAILPGNFKIKKAKIRGIESNGMICSEKELNISEEHDGIMVLPNRYLIGKNFATKYAQDFNSIELDVTPNRSDALSHLGVARDIACAKNRDFKPLLYKKPLTVRKKSIDISIENNSDCMSYVCGIVKGIKVEKSPKWLIDRLIMVGQKSVNNIVDISNYIMLETGQPTHIFDYNKINGDSISIRRAKKGETLIGLDEKKYNLDTESLIISDFKSPIALAGILGGQETSINNNTDEIFIESAFFNPVTIRKSSKNNQISTDASKRFERGTDPLICRKIFYKIIELIQENCGGELITDIIESGEQLYKDKLIKLKYSKLELVLGLKVEKKVVLNILVRLGFSIIKSDKSVNCIAPSFRPDILREIDIIEEIARMIGYDSIISDENLYGTYNYKSLDNENNIDLLKKYVSSLGFHQIYSNSLQSEVVSRISGKKPIKMINPLSQKMSYLRTSLIPGLLYASNFNIKNNTVDFRLFELGMVHRKDQESINKVLETRSLAFIMHGLEKRKSIYYEDIKEDLFNLKGVLIAIFEKKFNLNLKLIKNKYIGYDQAHKIIINNIVVGAMGIINENYFEDMKINYGLTYGCEINLTAIEKMLNKGKRFKKINVFPKIKRDLNFLLDINQEIGLVSDLILKNGKGLIKSCLPINIFEDPDLIGKNLKSVTYSITFQHKLKTLKDKDVNLIIDEIISSSSTNFNAILRT
jgi:phenylalanyl-tRNA synthetase beta chain